MNYKNECLKRFNALPADIKEKVGGLETVQIINDLEVQYKIKLKFLVILVTIGELKIKDISDYLIKKYKINQNDALIIKQRLLNDVFSQFADKKRSSNEINYAQKIKNIFQQELLKIITGDNDNIMELDEAMIFLFSASNHLKQEELIDLFFSNQEELSNRPFVLDDKQMKSTIANWLRDFIKQEGAEMFDNMKLSKFITNSPNASVLNSDERELLRKILLTYRNLKFFPDSMGELPPEQWQIIPYEREEELTKTSARLVTAVESMPQPSKTPTFQTGAAPGFYFHPEDEAEAAKFKPSPAVTKHQMDWPELAAAVIKNGKIAVGDEVLAKRLQKIILLNLKDIRDDLETKDALTRPAKVGGLGLDDQQAGEIINLIKSKGQELPDRFKELIDRRAKAEAEEKKSAVEKKMAEFRQRQEHLAEHARASNEITKQRLADKLDVGHELAPPPAAISLAAKKPAGRPPVVQPRPAPRPIQPIRQFRPPASAKPKIQDVKAVPKLVGPLEELKNMNLVDFHRLSANPQVAAQKIKEQIDLLEEESFAKRLAGIKAWRQSDLYRLYLNIGQEGLGGGRLIKDIIGQRQTAGQPALTEAEFEAVMDLNKSLRF